jgi:hypothetical protein
MAPELFEGKEADAQVIMIELRRLRYRKVVPPRVDGRFSGLRHLKFLSEMIVWEFEDER